MTILSIGGITYSTMPASFESILQSQHNHVVTEIINHTDPTQQLDVNEIEVNTLDITSGAQLHANSAIAHRSMLMDSKSLVLNTV